MAQTVTFQVTKDARIARRESDNWDSGSGVSTGLPFGLYQGYRYRVLLGFSINMAGWTAITAADLHYRTSNAIHVAIGSDPDIMWQRITSAWSEGSSNGLSGTNAVIFPGPSTTSTNQANVDVPPTQSAWGQTSILAMMRDVLAGQPFYGIRGMAWSGTAESDSSADVGEFFSREYGSGAYITITYETNRAPGAVTISSPSVVAGVSAGLTPSFSLLAGDPDGDQIANIAWQLDDTADFTSPVATGTPAGPWAQPHTEVIVAPALVRGTTYYLRARSTDSKGAIGGWSSTFSFKVAGNPTVVITEPSAAGRLGKLVYPAGSAWASPRLEVDWTFTCPDGGTQATYQVQVAVDSAGLPGSSLYDSLDVVNAATRSLIVGADLTEGAYYHVSVSCVCSHGVRTTVGYYRIRARWGVVTHRFDMGVVPVSGLSISLVDITDSLNGGGAGSVILEHATTTTVAVPGGWFSSIAGAGLGRYYWYRAWLLSWGVSPAVSPALNELKISYGTNQIVPELWNREDPSQSTGDVGAYVYGTKSLRMAGKGASHSVSQLVSVVPRTSYILSGRIQSQGAAAAQIAIAAAPTGPPPLLAVSPALGVAGATETFDQEASRVNTPIWYSGEATQAYVRCIVAGPVGSIGWFDALKLEASTVVTPWQPGFVANAVVIDAGGVQIDASAGGIFRIRSGDGTREIVTNADGLMGVAPYVGPAPPTQPWAGELWWDTAARRLKVYDTGAWKFSGDLPTGAVSGWVSDVLPTGWLLCDGTSYLRTDYPALFAIIGTTYGSVDATHFTVPDLRGRFPIGKGTDPRITALALSGGALDHVHSFSAVISHEHSLTYANALGTGTPNPVNSTAAGGSAGRFGGATGGTAVGGVASANTSTGSGPSPFLVVNFIIKT